MAMEIAMRYVATAAFVGVLVWYYGGFDKVINQYFTPTPQPKKSESAEKTAKKKRARNKLAEAVNSGTESASTQEKKKKISAPVAGTVTASLTGSNQDVALPRMEDGNQDDKEFARQLASAKSGVNFKASNKQNGGKSKARTVKQNRADLDSPHMSAENSSTGQDGDDETTPAGSPAFGAVTSESAANSTGVDDMLEPAREGPKSLRLTGQWEEAKSKTPKEASKAPEQVETKKQRQQKRKRKEEKERIAQSAKEHQAKGQQQMRTARIAEGTSKQTKADSFGAQSNVWTATDNRIQQNKENQRPINATSVAPLDTFEPKSATVASNSGAVAARPLSEIKDAGSMPAGVNSLREDLGNSKTNALGASDREKAPQSDRKLQRTTSWADDVNEEEQIRLLTEDQPEAWSSVTNKKDRKKAKKADEESHSTLGTATHQLNGQRTAVNGKTNSTSLNPQSKVSGINRYKSLETESTNNGLGDGLGDGLWEA